MTEHSQHTPGPWTYAEARGEENELCFYSIHGPDGKYISSTWGGGHEPNARLIAAAPDLLAENKRLREALRAIAIGYGERLLTQEEMRARAFDALENRFMG